MLRIILIAGALVAAAPAFGAQEAAPTPRASPAAPSPDALAAARDLLHAINFEAQMMATARRASDATFDTTVRQMESRLGADVPSELESQIRAIVRDGVEQMLEEMRPTALEQAAQIYARYFTAEEIRELQRLQTNPVMIKAQRLGPQLATELMQIGVTAAAHHQPEVMRRIDATIQAWQQAHPSSPQAAPVS